MSQISDRLQEELNNAAVEKPSTIRHLGAILQQIEDVQVLDRQADFAMKLQNSLMKRVNLDGDNPTF